MKKRLLKSILFLFCVFTLSLMPVAYASDFTPDTTESSNNVSEEDNNIAPDNNTEPGTDTTPDTDTTPEVTPVKISLSGKLSATKTVKLTWTSDDKNATYRLFRRSSKDGKASELKSFTGKEGTLTYSNKDLKLGQTYYFHVEKYNDDILTGESSLVAVRIRVLAPTKLKTSVDSSRNITVSWRSVNEANRYIVYRAYSKNGTYKKIAVTSKTSYKDKNTVSAKAYYYKVRAYKKGVDNTTSLYSDMVAAYTKPLKTTISATYSSSKVKITWKEVSRATKYYVYRKNSKGEYVRIGSTTKKYYYDKNAKANYRYYYKVRAAYTANGKTIFGNSSDYFDIFTAKVDPKKKMVALTFDDGPGPYTQAIIDCLKENNSRATFFVLGERVNSYKSEIKSAYKHGNEIANHSYSHPTLTRLSTSDVKSQISRTDSRIKKLTGKTTELVRAPGGATNNSVRNAIDKPFIYWSIDTLDWKHKNASKTINHVMNNVEDGDIILMHDIHKASKDAALKLIPKLRKKGYQLVTVSELAKYRGYKLKDHTTYYSFEK